MSSGDPRAHARIEAGLVEQARALRATRGPSLEPRIQAALDARERRPGGERRWPWLLRAAALLLGLLTVGWLLREAAPGAGATSKEPGVIPFAAALERRAPSFDVFALPRLLNAAAPPEHALLAEVRGLEHDSRAALRFLLARVRLGPGPAGG